MRGDHDRDAAGLLPAATPERHAGLRLHAPGDRRAECLRGRGQGHQQVREGTIPGNTGRDAPQIPAPFRARRLLGGAKPCPAFPWDPGADAASSFQSFPFPAVLGFFPKFAFPLCDFPSGVSSLCWEKVRKGRV